MDLHSKCTLSLDPVGLTLFLFFKFSFLFWVEANMCKLTNKLINLKKNLFTQCKNVLPVFACFLSLFSLNGHKMLCTHGKVLELHLMARAAPQSAYLGILSNNPSIHPSSRPASSCTQGCGGLLPAHLSCLISSNEILNRHKMW